MNPRQSEASPLLTGRQSQPPGSAQVPLPQQRPPRTSTRNIDWRRLFVFIFPYIFPQSIRLRIYMVLSFLCVLLAKLSKLIPPLAFKWAVDSLSASNPTVAGSIPFIAIAALYFGQVGESILTVFRQITYAIVSTGQTRIYSVACFRHTQHLDVSYHVNRRTGQVTRLMGRGADSIDSFINLLVYTLFPTLLEAVLVFGIFLKLGTPSIALSTLLSVILYVMYTKIVTERRIKLRRDLNEASEKVADKEVDTLANYETVKYFGNEEYETEQYDVLQGSLQDQTLKFRVSLQALNLGQKIIQVTGTAVSLLLAARAAAHGTLTAGDFVMVSQFIAQLFSPLTFLGTMYRMLVRSATDIEKSMDLFEIKSKVQDLDHASIMHISERDVVAKEKGSLTFENVTFRYETSDGRQGGVRNINFHIKPGEILGIVGSSGAGKSTLIRLIVRFYDPDEGRVLIDGEDIRNFTQSSLRQKFGVVAQDTSLFNRSLRYNISFGKVTATDQELYRAIEAAQLTEFVQKLPEKLDTLVGERGVKLSGGEKQRVGVARCILRQPLFVLLDEASSSLDSETEREMQKAVQEICRGRTTVAVAHRLSTVMNANCIIVLDGGEIVESGTHDELLRANGKYKSMWVAQTESQDNKRNSSRGFFASKKG